MYKLLSSSRDSDGSSIGFQRSIEARERELANIKITEEIIMLQINHKMILVLKSIKIIAVTGWPIKKHYKESDNHVLSHLAGAIDSANPALTGRGIIDDISLYVPHYIPCIFN